jgi:hypothetical protein
LKLRAAAARAYEILHLMPVSEARPSNPCYRIKSVKEKHDRIVAESELRIAQNTSCLP